MIKDVINKNAVASIILVFVLQFLHVKKQKYIHTIGLTSKN